MALPVFILAGPPGAGKGTQAELLAKRLDGVHLSSGEILRHQASRQVQAEMRQGELVTEAEVDQALEAALEAAPTDRPWILDGFIRLSQDMNWLEGCLLKLGRPITQVMLLDLSPSESQARVAKRDRSDDQPQVVDTRWQQYREKTLPALQTLAATNRLTKVNGVGSIDEVAQRVAQVIV